VLTRFTGRMCNIQRNCSLAGAFRVSYSLPPIKIRLYSNQRVQLDCVQRNTYQNDIIRTCDLPAMVNANSSKTSPLNRPRYWLLQLPYRVLSCWKMRKTTHKITTGNICKTRLMSRRLRVGSHLKRQHSVPLSRLSLLYSLT
jgi:hypothetical protein